MERVRNRDRRCCITGERVPYDNYDGFEAAHIFPIGQTDTVSFLLLYSCWFYLSLSSGIS